VRKILVLSAGFGQGHHSASAALKRATELLKADGEEVELLVVDPLKRPGDELYPWSRRMYLRVIRTFPWLWGLYFMVIDQPWHTRLSLWMMQGFQRRLKALLAEVQPDVVVSTYPIFPHFLEYYRMLEPYPGCANVIVVTDSITVNSVWTGAKCDALIVPNRLTAAVVRGRGIPEAKILPLGFAVNPDIATELERCGRRIPPRDGQPTRVLYMINAGRLDSEWIARDLAGIPDVDLTITVAFDVRLLKALRKEMRRRGGKVKVLGWTKRHPELFASSHLLVAKAGGATTQEALAANLPMIVTNAVPGQEPGNAKLLQRLGAGIFLRRRRDVRPLVERLIANNCAELAKLAEAGRGAGSPEGAMRILRFLMAVRPGVVPRDETQFVRE
jgi:UDP-N-acetylglucosamine:LPS N-acetylglucosamine transferase